MLVAVALVGAFAPTGRAAAQEYIEGLNYSMGIPSGDTKKFTNNESWLGLAFDGQWFASPNASAGIMLGWNEFYERTSDRPFELENGTITGQQYRHLNVFPMLVSGRIYLNRDKRVDMSRTMYIGMGTGAYYVRQLFSMGTSQFTTDSWLFGVAPEAGFLFPLGVGNLGTIQARYHYPFSGGDFMGDGGGAKSIQYWSIQIGVSHSM